MQKLKAMWRRHQINSLEVKIAKLSREVEGLDAQLKFKQERVERSTSIRYGYLNAVSDDLKLFAELNHDLDGLKAKLDLLQNQEKQNG